MIPNFGFPIANVGKDRLRATSQGFALPDSGFPIPPVGKDRLRAMSQGLVRPDSFWFFLTFDVPDR